MMATKRRIDEPRISIFIRSGAATGSDRVKEKKEYESALVIKITEKVHDFDIQKEK